MPFGSWVAEAVIRFNILGLSQMERANALTTSVSIREAELTGALAKQEGQWLRVGLAADAAASARRAAFMRVAGGIALGGAATIDFALDQAANYERSMLNLRIATAASRTEMDAFRKSIYDTAAVTAQSVPTIASLYGDIASTSGLPANSLTPAFLAEIAKFGEIVQIKSAGTTQQYTAPEAAKQLIELAHQYRAYTPAAISTFAEMLHKATYFMPSGLAQFLRQSTYFTPIMDLSAGNTAAMQQSVMLGTLLQQTGLGRGKGGTSLRQFEQEIIQGLAMTSHVQGGRRAALEAAGLIDKNGDTPYIRHNAQGSYFDMIGALSQVQRYMDEHTTGLTGAARDRAEESILRNVLSALGVRGSLIALVAAGGGLQQMRNVQARINNIPNITTDQVLRLKTFWGELQRSVAGLETVFTTLGVTILPAAEREMHAFNLELATFNKMLEEHPGVAKGIMTLIVYLTAATTLRVVGAATIKFVQFIGVLGTAGTEAGAAASGVGALSVALKLLNPQLILIATVAGFLKGLQADAQYVKHHPGNKMFGSNYGGDNGPYSQDVDVLGRPIQHGFRAPFVTPAQQLQPIHTHSVHVHNPVIQVQSSDPKEAGIAVFEALANPRSALYQSTRTHKNIPLATSVPPR